MNLNSFTFYRYKPMSGQEVYISSPEYMKELFLKNTCSLKIYIFSLFFGNVPIVVPVH